LNDGRFQLLGTLNICGTLLATVGGFGAVASFLGLTGIRGYNRISVFLAFFGFLAVARVWQHVEASRGVGNRVPRFVLFCAVLAGGLFDQIPRSVIPNYSESKENWTQEENYVASLEALLKPGSAVFQLPYVPFPEYPPIVKMVGYDEMRPYLHSKSLRWSFGTMKGRPEAYWIEGAAELPVEDMIRKVATAGYAGISIDRFGYADQAAALESQMRNVLGKASFQSANGRHAFYSLSVVANGIPEPVRGIPPVAKWGGGFSQEESNGKERWRWCGESGSLQLTNLRAHTVWVQLRADIRVGSPQAIVQITGKTFADDLITSSRGLLWSRTIPLPPGDHVIAFRSSSPRIPAVGDSRYLVFVLYNFGADVVVAPLNGTSTFFTQRPLEVTWGRGSYPEESGPVGNWHWCQSSCDVIVTNGGSDPARARLTFTVSAGSNKDSHFFIEGPGLNSDTTVNSSLRQCKYLMDFPPGRTVVKLSSDAPKIQTTDPRTLNFMVSNLALSLTVPNDK
jgi:phosphoglycerol transferase